MKENYTIYNKSCLKMSNLKDHSVKLVFTSPPYWDLKDYEIKDQIGYKQTYDKYLDDLLKVWKECFRVLDKDGILIFKWNEAQIPIKQVLECTIHKPLFGHRTMINNKTIWMAFMKGVSDNGI